MLLSSGNCAMNSVSMPNYMRRSYRNILFTKNWNSEDNGKILGKIQFPLWLADIHEI
jgi:hypothetical protein